MEAERQVGVEEEMFLVDPDTRHLLARSDRAVDAAGDVVEQELFLQQVEMQSDPHRGMTDLFADLRATRHAAARAADAIGARIAAVPTPILVDHGSVTHKDRYERMLAQYGLVGRRSMACGMHVHVEIANEDEGVAIIDRMAPWLPLVLAMSASSPFNMGIDTGYASWRAEIWESWPTAGAVQPFGDATGYHRAVAELITSGAALDEGMMYFDARLSRMYPTVEIRVADVCTDLRDVITIAAVLRSLVDTCADDWSNRTAFSPWRVDLLRAARWRARRFGLTDSLVDPLSGCPRPADQALDTLLRKIGPALDRHGDGRLVADGISRLLREGTGAERHREVAGESLDLIAVVDDVLERTLGTTDSDAR